MNKKKLTEEEKLKKTKLYYQNYYLKNKDAITKSRNIKRIINKIRKPTIKRVTKKDIINILTTNNQTDPRLWNLLNFTMLKNIKETTPSNDYSTVYNALFIDVKRLSKEERADHNICKGVLESFQGKNYPLTYQTYLLGYKGYGNNCMSIRTKYFKFGLQCYTPRIKGK